MLLCRERGEKNQRALRQSASSGNNTRTSKASGLRQPHCRASIGVLCHRQLYRMPPLPPQPPFRVGPVKHVMPDGDTYTKVHLTINRSPLRAAYVQHNLLLLNPRHPTAGASAAAGSILQMPNQVCSRSCCWLCWPLAGVRPSLTEPHPQAPRRLWHHHACCAPRSSPHTTAAADHRASSNWCCPSPVGSNHVSSFNQQAADWQKLAHAVKAHPLTLTTPFRRRNLQI